MTVLDTLNARLPTPRSTEGTPPLSGISSILPSSSSTTRTARPVGILSRLIPTAGPNTGESPWRIFSSYAAPLSVLYLDVLPLPREMPREYSAEMLGTMVMIFFGNGVDCQVVLSSNTSVSPTGKGDYLSLNFGWACGTLFPLLARTLHSIPILCVKHVQPEFYRFLLPIYFIECSALYSPLFLSGAALGVWISGGISGGHINPVAHFYFYFPPQTVHS